MIGRTLPWAGGGALVGAALAALLFVHPLQVSWPLLATVLVAVLVGIALGVLLPAALTGPPLLPPPPIAHDWSSDERRLAPPTPPTSPPSPPSERNHTPPVGTPPQTVRLLLPVDERATGTTWWDRGATPATNARAPGRATLRAQAPELAAYRAAARVVQCPRCGAFRVDVQAGRSTGGYAFRCRVDDHEWQWWPGAPWPETVVAANRRLR